MQKASLGAAPCLGSCLRAQDLITGPEVRQGYRCPVGSGTRFVPRACLAVPGSLSCRPTVFVPQDCVPVRGVGALRSPRVPACWPFQGGCSGCSCQGPAADPAVCTLEPVPLHHPPAAGEKPALAECLLRTESHLEHASNCPHHKTSLRRAAPLHAHQNTPEVTRTNAF